MTSEYLVRLGLAALVGALIGAEREYRDKAAGFRTIILICIGACLFTIFGLELITPERGDPTRVASAIVSGVGFLGAGVIFRRGKMATGITTAATVWTAAALGMGLGGGLYALSLIAAVGILAILWLLPPLETVIDRQSRLVEYTVTSSLETSSVGQLHDVFTAHGLRVTRCTHGRKQQELRSEIFALGKYEQHSELMHDLLEADWVLELSN